MTETIAYINASLKDIYPSNEIDSFIRLIMDHVCGLSSYQLLMSKDKELSEKERKEVRSIVERLKRSEPIQYILGETFFCGLPFKVNTSVLIPRPETEELVDRIIKENRQKTKHILDIGTGSGCIAVTLAKNISEAEVYAIDISNEAIRVAKENAKLNDVNVTFYQTDILLETNSINYFPYKFNIIVSNPPYVMEKEKVYMEKNVLFYEPSNALFVPDNDPLVFYRAIARFGINNMEKDGSLYVEINAQCGKGMVRLLEEEGYKEIELINDIFGKDRFIKAKL